MREQGAYLYNNILGRHHPADVHQLYFSKICFVFLFGSALASVLKLNLEPTPATLHAALMGIRYFAMAKYSEGDGADV